MTAINKKKSAAKLAAQLKQRDNALAKRLKLSKELSDQLGLRKLSNSEARSALQIPGDENAKDYSGTGFEGYDLDGNHRGLYQVRRDSPEMDDKGKDDAKYVCKPRDAEYPYINTTPGGLKDDDHLIVVESVKSSYAITASAERAGRKNIRVVDIHGIPGWRVKVSRDSDESHPNRDFKKFKGHRVTLALDSNFMRDDLIDQVVKFDNFLNELGCKSVDAVKLDEEPGINGPDDLIEKKGDKKFWEKFDQRQPLIHHQCPAVSDFAGQEMKVELLINHLFADHTLSMFASPSENYKTMTAMCSCKSLLSKVGSRAFECDEFKVLKNVPGVLYMVPDMSHELAVVYARKFGLDQKPYEGKFRLRTMKQGPILSPDSPIVIRFAKMGWFIVMDTANYFTDADDDNNPQQFNKFIQKARKLIDRHGASGVLMLVHPTKAGATSNEVDVTQWVSGTYAKIGSVDAIFAMRKIKDEQGTPLDIWVSREKSRPFMGVPLQPFKLMLLDENGKSTIDQGRLPVRKLNAGALSESLPKKSSGGAPPHPKKESMMGFIRNLINDNAKRRNKPIGRMEILKALDACPDFNPPDPKTGKKNGCGVSDRTIGRWLDDERKDKKNVKEIAGHE
jgi:hypothetical protein